MTLPLALTGAPNFRDLGGYRSADGRSVRHHRLFRSDHLAHLAPADLQALANALGPAVRVLDLRGEAERATAACAIPGATVHSLPIEPTVVQKLTDLLAMESFPVQFSLLLKGNLPTPCHELRAVYYEPDADNKIKLEIYSVAKLDAVCVQMLQPFEQGIYLGSFPSGHYTVWVNGEQVAEFDA